MIYYNMHQRLFGFTEGTEEILDEQQPLKFAQRTTDKKVHLFLRYRDLEQDKTALKVAYAYPGQIVDTRDDAIHVQVYGGWLRIPITFCTLVVDYETTVESVVKDSLTRFNLNSSCYSRYNLVEVSLDRGGKWFLISINLVVFSDIHPI